MNDLWCLRQIEDYDDSFAPDWELASLESAGTNPARIVPLDQAEVSSWAQRHATTLNENAQGPSHASTGSVAILILRHKQYKTKEINPQYLPLRRGEFLEIIKVLGLPPEYVYMRGHAGASGSFSMKHSIQEGRATTIGLSVRVPHSPTSDIKSVWSLALVWNTTTGVLTGIFEGATDKDTQFVLDAINSDKRFHPWAFPLYLLELLTIYYNDMRREHSSVLLRLEREAGLTRGNNPRAWFWNEEQFRRAIKDVNSLNTHLAYLERRLDFVSRFARFLKEEMSETKRCAKFPEEQAMSGFKTIRERLCNVENFLGNQIHHVQCLQKRSATVISVVYSVISQQDSSSNLKIARAAKEDSEVMKLIALLTTFFLPAMFISSVFGMNFFVFDTEQSRINLSQDFWIYWAVVTPITVSLVLVGSYSIWRRQSRWRRDDIINPTDTGVWTNEVVPDGPFWNSHTWLNPEQGVDSTTIAVHALPRH